MTHDTIVILGIPIDNLTMDETIERIFELIEAYGQDGRPRQVATVNVDFVVNTLSWGLKHIRHPELLDILRRADLVTADGMPIVWTSKLLGVPLKERVTGAALIPRLAEEAAKRQKSLYFLGGREGVGQQAAQVLKQSYPDLRIADVHSPYVYIEGEDLVTAVNEDRPLVERINNSGADILLIAFGNPKQEIWFHRNRNLLKVPVSIGIGGTYEFIVGSVARAPEWMQKTGMEWIFRIAQDPGRLWKRYFVGFFKFGLMIWPAIMYQRYRRLQYHLFHRRYSLQKDQGLEPLVSIDGFLKVITLPDRLDAAFLNQFRDELEERIGQAQNIVLDFSQTSFIDSSGLGFIIYLWRNTTKEERTLYMTGINPHIIQFFKLNRLWDLFQGKFFEEVNEIFAVLREKTTLPPFYFVTEAETGFTLVSLFGRLDAAQMSTLDVDLIISDIGDRNCILNLGELDFVDSSGIVFFLKIQRHISSQGKICLLCELTDNIQQMFRITKLIRLFQIVPDISSAKKELVESA
ncbi:MAG: WecB/TagA/CpsF family glycosyltransferase [Thermodesulfobacteriota bacterium]|nr:WecB/TagA/CpsF family glycosyltransferase [Thermodesulfobacteriota bacterium]